MDLDHDVMKLAKMPANATDGLFPIFHHETRLDKEATEKAGFNVYKKVPYVEIIAPGNDKERINRQVKESDKERWPEQWRAFEEGHGEGGGEMVIDGTPLSEWALCEEHFEKTLAGANVYTVEQLAEVSDPDIQMLGPGMINLKYKARDWVKAKGGDNEETEKLRQRIEELKREAAETKVEVVVKNGSWYKYNGVNYRKGDLPGHVLAVVEEYEE